MRKLLFLLALLFPLEILAGNISVNKAQLLAEKFLNQSSTKAAGSVRLIWDGETTPTKSSSEPAYYVFQSDGGGFVIISACDAVNPVLGYSYTGTFKTENMPDNLADWMGRLRTEIIKVRESGEKPSLKVQKEWDMFTATASLPAYSDKEKYYDTALWDQSDPYNKFCPKEGSKTSVTGCVATATGIVMRQREWPEAGKGKLPNYSDPTGRSWELGHQLGTYEWDKMPMSFKQGTYTEEQADQVAQLLYDLGVMCKMIYSPTGSGTVTSFVGPGLAKYMSYDKSVSYMFRHTFSEDEWMNKLKNEIDNVGPIVYSGQQSSGGHAFVVAGYDESNFLYINWGWSGSNNGYFSLTSMGGFSYDNGAVFNMYKDRGGEDPGVSVRYQNISVSPEYVRKGDNFSVELANVSGVHREGMIYLAVGHFNSDDELKEIVSVWYVIEGNFWNYYTSLSFQDCKIKQEIKKGDYLRPVYLTDTQAEELDAIPALFDDEEGGSAVFCLDYPIMLKTSFSFDKLTNKIIVSVSDASNPGFKLVSKSGQEISAGVSIAGSTMTIDKSVVAAGEYTLEITVEVSNASMELKL